MQRHVIVKHRRLLPADIKLRGAAQMLAEALGHPFRRVGRLAGEIGDHGLDARIGPLDQADAEIHDPALGHRLCGGREERLAGGVMLEHGRVKQNGVAAFKLRMLHPVAAKRRRFRHNAAGGFHIGPEQQPGIFEAAGADDESVRAKTRRRLRRCDQSLAEVTRLPSPASSVT